MANFVEAVAPTAFDNLNAAQSFTKVQHSDTYDFISPKHVDLSGRSVLITGASKGIGRATSLSYAAAGCSKIAIAARSDLSSLEKELKAVADPKSPPQVLRLKVDVTSEDSVKAAAETVAREFGGALDILINNAGYSENWKPIAESNATDWLAEFINVEYGDQGLVCFAIHPGSVLTEVSSNMWLGKESRPWLGGRFVSVSWDMQELEAKSKEIAERDILKFRLTL